MHFRHTPITGHSGLLSDGLLFCPDDVQAFLSFVCVFLEAPKLRYLGCVPQTDVRSVWQLQGEIFFDDLLG